MSSALAGMNSFPLIEIVQSGSSDSMIFSFSHSARADYSVVTVDLYFHRGIVHRDSVA
jgi:hypothetical protein